MGSDRKETCISIPSFGLLPGPTLRARCATYAIRVRLRENLVTESFLE